jgi:hypothetical protein
VETNESSRQKLPLDIQRALQRHDAMLRLSGEEIISGINRLLREGIPKEVICQVVTRTIETVAKDFNPLTPQLFYSRIETQLDAFTREEANLREPPHSASPAALGSFAVEESAPTAENSSIASVPKCGEISASGMSLTVSDSLHDLIPGAISYTPDSAAKLTSEKKKNMAVVSPIPSFHLMPLRGENRPLGAAKGNQKPASEKRALTLDAVNQLPPHHQRPHGSFAALQRIRQSTFLAQVLLRRWVFEFKRDWTAMFNVSALSEMTKSFLRWSRQPIPSNSWRKTAVARSKPVATSINRKP